jgi:D5 N terminal like
MSGFTAKEFEPDPTAVPGDDDDVGGAAPGPGHNRHGKPTLHAKVGQTMLGMMLSRGKALRNIHDLQKRTHLWYYRDGLWTMLPEPDKWLNHAIEVTLRTIGKANKSTNKFVTEVRKYIERSPDIQESSAVVWDAHGKVPTRSGLIDPITLAVEPFKKEHFATWRLDLDYDPAATCPLWLELLGDYFVDKPPSEREQRITLLQEYAGTTLIDQLPKALAVC